MPKRSERSVRPLPKDRQDFGRVVLALSLLGGIGCGGAQTVLKEPLTGRCDQAKLKSCPDLVGGVILYADGRRAKGQDQLKAGMTGNDPAALKQYAESVKSLIDTVPISYAQPLGDVAAILVTPPPPSPAPPSPPTPPPPPPVAVEPAKPAPPTRAPEAPRPATPAPEDALHLRTRTIVPAIDESAVKAACEGPLAMAKGGLCSRVRVLAGPFVVTDLYAPSGCSNELFAYAGSATEKHRWIVVNPASTALSVHGARLFVRPEDELYVGSRSEKGPLRSDVQCSITLSGWKPGEESPSENKPSP
jgi:hypothetical protein